MRTALADFQTSLNRIRALANSIVAATAAALASAAIRDLHETQQCGSVVLLTGYFEVFLKDLVRRYTEELSVSGLTFTSLPEDIRNQHYEGGGKILTSAAVAARGGKPMRIGSATREDIVARLFSASSTTSYQIVWEAFADTQSNPGPSVVKEIASGLGLKDFWRTCAAMSGDATRWSDTALRTQLGDLISKRNACAHTGSVSPVPTAADILDFADLLSAIGTGFVAVLEAELTAHKSTVTPPSPPTLPPATSPPSPP